MLFVAKTREEFCRAAQVAHAGDTVNLLPGDYRGDYEVVLRNGVTLTARGALFTAVIAPPGTPMKGGWIDLKTTIAPRPRRKRAKAAPKRARRR